MMAPDVVSFAIKRGYWSGAADDPAFSFSDICEPQSPPYFVDPRLPARP